jgi:DNA-binding transcriptional LysR family regulator
MDVNLRQIRSFVVVAQAGSFTRAAELLHLAQPTLTVQIRRLEETLEVRLFDRNTRSVELTRVGRELLPVFQRMIRDLDAVVVDTRDLAAKRRGVVRIAALPSVAAGALPDVISSFRELQPGASFILKDVIANRVLDLVRSEEVDLGIMGGSVVGQDIEVLLEVRDRMHVVFPAGHPIGAIPKVSIDDLIVYPLVLMDPATSVRAVVDAAFLGVGHVAQPTCEATYMMTAIAMVRAGLGITILPGSAREISAEPDLRSRRVDVAGFSRAITIIKKAGRTLPPISEAFGAHLAKAMRAQEIFTGRPNRKSGKLSKQ